MKKTIISLICFLLFFTNISFADTNDIKQTIKDIELVNNNINIIVKKVIGDEKLDINALEKDIKFSESILGERTKKYHHYIQLNLMQN